MLVRYIYTEDLGMIWIYVYMHIGQVVRIEYRRRRQRTYLTSRFCIYTATPAARDLSVALYFLIYLANYYPALSTQRPLTQPNTFHFPFLTERGSTVTFVCLWVLNKKGTLLCLNRTQQNRDSFSDISSLPRMYGIFFLKSIKSTLHYQIIEKRLE